MTIAVTILLSALPILGMIPAHLNNTVLPEEEVYDMR